jgi:hypothetical protein
VLANTREAHETERRRRIAWEQEIETRLSQRNEDMQRAMFEMRQEIDFYKNLMTTNLSQEFMRTPQYNGFPMTLVQQQSPALALPISPVSQPSSFDPSAFAGTGASIHADDSQILSGDADGDDAFGQQPDNMVVEPLSPSPSPAPEIASTESSALVVPSTSGPDNRKRTTPDLTCSGEDGTEDESCASSSEQPQKRVNHHDKRVLTIHVGRIPFFIFRAGSHCSLASDARAHTTYDAIRFR